MSKFLLTIAYEGTHYGGWQRQLNRDTVQARLEAAFAAIGCPDVHVEGSGRTDAGVHAIGQCAHARIDRPFAAERLQLALNANLPADVAVQRAREVPDDFHARFHARGKRYLYRTVVSRARPAIGRNLFYWVRRRIDLAAMRRAAEFLRGTHDFAAFATNPGYPRKRGTVRTVQRVHLRRTASGFDFVIQGDGFLYNMVRTLIGSLLQVGYGSREPEWIAEVLASRDRANAGMTAPAAGLYLLRVLYAAEFSSGARPGFVAAEG